MTELQAKKILKIDGSYDEASLKKAYRRRAAETHPDKGGSAEDFQLVKEAYEYLLDPPVSNICMLITHKTLFKIVKKGC